MTGGRLCVFVRVCVLGFTHTTFYGDGSKVLLYILDIYHMRVRELSI